MIFKKEKSKDLGWVNVELARLGAKISMITPYNYKLYGELLKDYELLNDIYTKECNDKADNVRKNVETVSRVVTSIAIPVASFVITAMLDTKREERRAENDMKLLERKLEFQRDMNLDIIESEYEHDLIFTRTQRDLIKTKID